MKKLISVFLCIVFLVSSLSAVCAETSGEAYGFLEILGVTSLSQSSPGKSISVQQIKEVLRVLLGKETSPSSVERPDVVRLFVQELGYSYLLTEEQPETVFAAARQIRLLGNLILDNEGAMTCAELSELAVNLLNVPVLQQKGYSKDPEFISDSMVTVATERFGAVYREGTVIGVYGDGKQRVEPLWKNEVLIDGERYVLSQGAKYLNQKLRFAYIEKNGNKSVIFIERPFEISVREIEGKSGTAFFRRGIPFEEGELHDPYGVYLQDETGKVPELQNEVLETYWDGSIRWLSVAFTETLKANETKNYSIVFGNSPTLRSADIAVEEGKNIRLSNEDVSLVINQNGVESLSYRGKTVVSENKMTLTINDGSDRTFRMKDAKILANGGVYAQLKLTGFFQGSTTEAEWIFYLYRNINRLYQEAKFVVKGETFLSEEAFLVEFSPEFSELTLQPDSKTEGQKYHSDWIQIASQDTYVSLISQDTQRFSGAFGAQGVTNGFILNEKGNHIIKYAPIHTGVRYCWPDGIKRTTHLNLCFSDEAASIAQMTERELRWSIMAPILVIDSGRYVRTGWLEDNTQSEVLLRWDELISSLYGRLWNTFEAGKICNGGTVNYETRDMTPGTQDRSAGEVEFNLWKSFMNSGNPKMYELISEDSEHWTDIMMYWGKEEALHGANRYKTGVAWNNNRDFAMTQPYYADMSGIYMSYMMTGDPLLEEAFRTGVDFWEYDIRKNGVPILSYWWTDRTLVHTDGEYQARFMAQVRGMGLAYDMYKEKRFLDAIVTTGKNLLLFQNEDGGFYESYNLISKSPQNVLQPDGVMRPTEKYYIMLMGGRMVAETYNMHPNPSSLNVITRLADFLLSVQEADGWFFQPCRDYPELSERGCDGTTNCMAGAFFSEMYEATGETKYFEAMCKAFRFFSAQWNGGNSGKTMHTSLSTYVYGAPKVCRLLRENEPLALELGYADLIAAFQSQTVVNQDAYPDFDKKGNRFSLNVYDTVYGRELTFSHVSASHATTYADKAFDLDMCLDNNHRLWFGDTNTLLSDGVWLKREFEQVDMISLLQTAASLRDFEGEIRANIREYTRDKMVLELTGDSDVVFTLQNGFIPVNAGDRFCITDGGKETVLQTASDTLTWVTKATSDTHTVTIMRIAK